jgi:hypothetical protein
MESEVPRDFRIEYRQIRAILLAMIVPIGALFAHNVNVNGSAIGPYSRSTNQ